MNTEIKPNEITLKRINKRKRRRKFNWNEKLMDTKDLDDCLSAT